MRRWCPMADIQNLIKTINNKFTNNASTVSKIYRDEPILKTAAQMANYTPPKYREMRNLVKSSPVFYASDAAQIFYEQGKFMEDHTDDYQYHGEFQSYFPTYRYMTDQQLRGYFSWRTKVRDGIIEKTSLSFVFVYIYELLMQIGVSTAEEGFYKIKDFWQYYKDIDPKISHYIKLWLKDYVIFNGLEKHLLEDFTDIHYDHAVLTLINCHSHSVSEVFSALNTLSSYNLENSRFYKLYSDDVEHVVYHVFSELTEYYHKNRKNSICEKFFGKIAVDTYVMFNAAVFYNHEKHRDCVYEINAICKYRCKDGKWTYERFIFLKDKNKYIGELLKTIDFIMRQEYDFKSTLKVDKVIKVYQDIIQKVTRGLLEDKKKKSVPKIEIDISKLQTIRRTALETQNKLIVEDAEKIMIPEPVADRAIQADTEAQTDTEAQADTATQADAASQKDAANLSSIEYEFMKCLLYGKDYSDLIKSNGLMLSVLIDSINEKIFDIFSDTVLIFEGENPELIEDYEAELKEIIV
ncbi:hypothetical protein FRZ06_21410 [Anoxybacterium hadale]|uniref:Uncharacterized protein n=1 Tax=Anoxybacterium hadale TaxID=3408580 RepID=A0ACD1AH19_9FIRM|nr:hypothetical protein FRZ06_21410 [Clostridiales bacterium]